MTRAAREALRLLVDAVDLDDAAIVGVSVRDVDGGVRVEVVTGPPGHRVTRARSWDGPWEPTAEEIRDLVLS